MSPSRSHILDEIRRTAAQNGGNPLGSSRFLAETGIAESDWRGVYWARWGDALEAAGFPRKALQQRYTDDHLLECLVPLVRDLGRFPTRDEMKLWRRERDPAFPSYNVFTRAFGHKDGQARRLADFCRANPELHDVVPMCAALESSSEAREAAGPPDDRGFVYLIKSGRFYKIGRTVSLERRSRELRIQLPERHDLVHAIATDDPEGIERYWHGRFASPRKNGEWFDLDATSVAAFRRRKFM